MSTMNFSLLDVDKFKKNIINYQQKLENQSKEFNNLADSIEQKWSGKNAKSTIAAIRQSATDFKIMSDRINEYVPIVKKITDAIEAVHN